MRRMSHPGQLHNEITPTTAFGERLRAIRKARGLTLETVATLAHIHETTLSQIERGKSLPGVALVPRLAQALAVDQDEITTLYRQGREAHTAWNHPVLRAWRRRGEV